jgi:hypothetical protein
MADKDEHRSAAYLRAEQVLAQKNQKEQKEVERLNTRDKERRTLDEKIARLRALRLAKEEADRGVVKTPAPRAAKKSAKVI